MSRPSPSPAALAALAVLLVFALFWPQRRLGLSLGDEGFLWYGAVWAARGEVPLRDFQSYAPARYYWTAAWLSLLRSDGILAVRFAAAWFQALGLAAALVCARRVLSTWSGLLVFGVVAALWMFPLFRSFDNAMSAAAVLAGLRLLERPTRAAYLAAGALAGLAMLMGLNHGLYCAAALSSLAVYEHLRGGRGDRRNLLAWGLGWLAGSAPLLAMCALVPGFFGSLIDNASVWLRGPYLNVATRSVPWPWQADFATRGFLAATFDLVLGVFFLTLPILYLVATIRLRRTGDGPGARLLAASLFAGVPYMHYAFSRPDVFHLASAMPPLLLGVIGLAHAGGAPAPRRMAIGLAALMLASVLTVGVRQPIVQKTLVSGEPWSRLDAVDGRLWVRLRDAELVRTVRRLRRESVPPGETLLLAPHWPGLYPLLGLHSPVWEIFFLFPAEPARQLRMVADLRRSGVNWAVVCTAGVDGRPEWSFPRTHPLLWSHLTEAWEATTREGLAADCVVLHRRTPVVSTSRTVDVEALKKKPRLVMIGPLPGSHCVPSQSCLPMSEP